MVQVSQWHEAQSPSLKHAWPDPVGPGLHDGGDGGEPPLDDPAHMHVPPMLPDPLHWGEHRASRQASAAELVELSGPQFSGRAHVESGLPACLHDTQHRHTGSPTHAWYSGQHATLAHETQTLSLVFASQAPKFCASNGGFSVRTDLMLGTQQPYWVTVAT